MKTDSIRPNPTPNRSMPPGTIIPELAYDEVTAAAAWLCRTFGFKERLRIGCHRCQLTFGGTSIVVVAASEPLQGGLGHSMMVSVEDVDRHYEHAARQGAQIISPPTDYPYGERQYTAADPAGRRWTFSQSIADVDPRTWGGTLIEDVDA
jgi:uncharacterized glyoxalase superfamily protein PhnB